MDDELAAGVEIVDLSNSAQKVYILTDCSCACSPTRAFYILCEGLQSIHRERPLFFSAVVFLLGVNIQDFFDVDNTLI